MDCSPETTCIFLIQCWKVWTLVIIFRESLMVPWINQGYSKWLTVKARLKINDQLLMWYYGIPYCYYLTKTKKSTVICASWSLSRTYDFIFMSPVLNWNVLAGTQTRTSFIISESLHLTPLPFFCWLTFIGFHFLWVVASHVRSFWWLLVILFLMFFPPVFRLIFSLVHGTGFWLSLFLLLLSIWCYISPLLVFELPHTGLHPSKLFFLTGGFSFLRDFFFTSLALLSISKVCKFLEPVFSTFCIVP